VSSRTSVNQPHIYPDLIFTSKAGAYPSGAKQPSLGENIRQKGK
jgi:hypothetical protein